MLTKEVGIYDSNGRMLQDSKGRNYDRDGNIIPEAPAGPDVKAIRARLGLSQAKFAALFGIPVGTLRGWECGRRAPEGAARTLLRVIEGEPEAVKRALSS